MMSIALLTYVSLLAVIDVRTHRIPNVLSAALLTIALLLQGISGGVLGLLHSLGGLCVGLIIFMPFYLLRAFGAGDVKAMAVVGAFLNPAHAVIASAATLIAGGAIGVVVMLTGNVTSARQIWHRLLGVLLMPASLVRPPRNANGAASTPIQKFPYGVAIAAGALFTLWYTGRLSFLTAGSH